MMFTSRIIYLLLAAALTALFLWSDARQHAAAAPERPNDPWVFRSVLDSQPRMITFALNERLWAAYSTERCALYKAWEGTVAFEGAVYNMRHGPQPMTVGDAWFVNKFQNPWTVIRNGKTEYPQTDYKGHRYIKNGHAEILFDLVLADGQRIRIEEQPEFLERDHQPGFQRTFTLKDAPADAQVVLHFNAGSIADATNVNTNGALKITANTPNNSAEGLFAVDLEGELTLLPRKPTRLTTMFVREPLFPNPYKGPAEERAAATPGERLMAKNDCRTCHHPAVQTVGPGYAQIAERYKNTPENIDLLAKKVVAGGSGAWGVAAMSAHPGLKTEEARAMVRYVLGLDEGEDDGHAGAQTAALTSPSAIPENKWLKADTNLNGNDMAQGLSVRLFKLRGNPRALNRVDFNARPAETAFMSNIDITNMAFGAYQENFALRASGYFFLEKDDNVLFRFSSDDGARLYLDGRLLFDNDGIHGMAPSEAEVALRAGYHPLQLDYFQGGGDRGILLEWARPDQPEFTPVPTAQFSHKRSDADAELRELNSLRNSIPGDGIALAGVHPSYTCSQARPEGFLPKVGGMDFLSDGRLVVSTWDAMGGVYLLDNVQSGDPKKIKVKRIARGLAEPLGLRVVDDTIYVLQKQELTRLIDTDGDDIIDEYQCFAKGWLASANFHEFAFGLAYKDEFFYATLAIAILPGGASARPQIADRGKVVQISRADGSIAFVARGLRTPNGIGLGADGELFVADNQGDWLPASKILHIKPDAFFGSYAVDSTAVAALPVQQPVVWLPQDEIGNSPSEPAAIPDGPYKGQLLHGDVCYGGLQRVFMEKINGEYQGCAFRFSQGLEGGTNRLVWGPDGALYIGMIGNPGNWGQSGKNWYGLQRLQYNGQSAFEMLALRAKSNGLEIEFTEPLHEGDGWEPGQYEVRQWWYKPTNNYGGPKMDETALPVKSATVNADRKRVFLEIPGMQPGHVVYLRLHQLPVSDLNHELWTSEAWYTLNTVPTNDPGQVSPPPVFPKPGDNELSAKEKTEGWQLLFDGKSLAGWHNYGKKTVGAAWVVDENAIHLQTKPKAGGEWQQRDGGDILCADEYQDFEFQLDWKIGRCGNSGIIYNVLEDPAKYEYVWQTGPEMQVLDNTCHPDGRIVKHRAGDLYDLIACAYETVKPAGQWNHVRIVSRGGKVEHWLNHRKVVAYDRKAPEWAALIASSKFKEMPGFGKSDKGKISLQDHGDPVWYKNIKIRRF